MEQGKSLLKLVERCEQATGPNTELSFAIYAAISGKDYSHIKRSQRYLYGEPYTASLDAAMTLVPEGWRVRDFGDWEDRWLVTLMNEDTCETVEARSGRGLPSLALCAAALRARAAMGDAQ
jgi:hypothetical protein